MSARLKVLQDEVHIRCAQTTAAQPDWPCRKGCDDCCRSLASVPLLTEDEWQAIASQLDSLPGEVAAFARRRIRDSASASRPVVCPLLDLASGACLVYNSRPIACRTYGFYAERRNVLGCSRIESISHEETNVVWGNHETLQDRYRSFGVPAELHRWLAAEEPRF